MICRNTQKCIEEAIADNEWCGECREETTAKNVTRQERKKRYNLLNPKRYKVTVFKIDGGIVRNEEDVLACDYLFIVHKTKSKAAIFVELKGKDVYHAIKQITNSMDMFAGDFLETEKIARIICQSVPRIANDGAVIRAKKELLSKHQAKIEIHERNFDDGCCSN